MKSLRIGAVLSTGLAAVIAIAPGAHAQGAEKFELVGPNANFWCAPPHAPLDTPVITEGFGFVIFNQDQETNQLKTVVSIKDGQANTRYVIRVIQDISDCYTQDGVLTTNAQGNGTVSLAEPLTSTAAQVIVDTGAMFRRPSFRASEAYVPTTSAGNPHLPTPAQQETPSLTTTSGTSSSR